ncbi:MAG: dTDP-4-dehydrorhamnose reductase [Nitrospirae bacterium RIFCSPLOWO2_01_FULL_62_17]|nr:MAG: dTDP-4-dehydrorhamnose reductase [Nitrospirae bacterium RIFCSPLOWO2_01_FULL_62_17]
MRIVITGASGQLGHELQHVLQDQQLTLADLPEFDVTKAGVEKRVTAAQPDVIIHAAAYTDVDGAEREPAQAMAVNAVGTERVARGAAAAGARLLYLSTDYVFDGRQGVPYRETDRPNPLSVYGRSKYEGEQQALAHCPNALVIRTAWLYGTHGKNFVKTIMRQASQQSELRVVSDQRGSPTHAGDLASAIKQVLGTNLKGIVHATGAGDCTWYELAREIVSLTGSPARVQPISTAESGRTAQRPLYAVLSNRVLADAGISLPHWKDALSRFLSQVKVEVEAK